MAAKVFITVPPPFEVTTHAFTEMAEIAGAAFASALLAFADQERDRWNLEFEQLKEAGQQVQQAQSDLKRERFVFEEEKRRYAPAGGTELSEVLTLNVGGMTEISVCRDVLTQCDGSMLAAAFSGCWETPLDTERRIFVDFSPTIFLPLVDHLRVRRIEPLAPAPPLFVDSVADDQFTRMLRYYTILDWVYRQEPITHQIDIGEYSYSVLPSQPPDRGETVNEMRGVTAVVPRGWQPLSSNDEDFDSAIRELSRYGWGAGLLIVDSGVVGALGVDKLGFVGYRTRLSTSGLAGSRFDEPPSWFDDVSDDRRQFRFAGSSYRLVIRCPLSDAYSQQTVF